MSLPPHLQGSTSPVSAATDGQSGPGKRTRASFYLECKYDYSDIFGWEVGILLRLNPPRIPKRLYI